MEYHEKLETTVMNSSSIKLVMVSRLFSGMIHVNLLTARYPRNFDLSKEKDSLVF